MKKKRKLLMATTAAVVIVASITGIAVAGGPAWKTTATAETTPPTAAASSNATPETTNAANTVQQTGQGYGRRAVGSFSGAGSVGSGSAAVSTALSDAEEADLLLMREEEKLARDVYLSLYEQWGVSEFNTIAASESRHMASVERLLDRYGLVDPVTTDVRGQFVNPELDAAYDQLLAQGLQSVEEAYKVGVAIEQLDIDDLDRVIEETTHSDITRVMQNLLRGSENHLRAFSSLVG